MEKGFYHPDRGYWQTVGESSSYLYIKEPAIYSDELDEWGEPIVLKPAVMGHTSSLIETYPSGTIEVPLKPSADHIWQNGGWIYVEPEPLTSEQQRALMPRKSMVQFRTDLRSIKVVEHLDEDGVPYLDGIYEEDILAKIELISDKALRAEARDYFLHAEYIERVNPWVDILGAMFGLTPEQIDARWNAAAA